MDLVTQLRRDLTEELRRDEGDRLKPYRDSKGLLTIGTGFLIEGAGRRTLEAIIGHALDDAIGITQEEDDKALAWCIDSKTAQLYEALPWTRALDEPRLGALLNLAFNMGVHALTTFVTFLSYMADGRYERAAADLFGTKWASDVGKKLDPPGRAVRICRQIQTGVWV